MVVIYGTLQVEYNAYCNLRDNYRRRN